MYAHDEPGLPFEVAKARGECQFCGERGARVCAARALDPPKGKTAPWYVAVLCGECIEGKRTNPRVEVVAEAG